MTRLSKIAALRVFRVAKVPTDYAEKPWCYPAPIAALSAAFRSEPETPAGTLAPEVEKMWETHCSGGSLSPEARENKLLAELSEKRCATALAVLPWFEKIEAAPSRSKIFREVEDATGVKSLQVERFWRGYQTKGAEVFRDERGAHKRSPLNV